jgi:Flp pilus assembly protein TadG
MTDGRATLRSERGVTAIEVCIIVPVLSLFFTMFVFVGQIVNMSQIVKEATHDAARAASLQRTRAGAREVAETVMRENVRSGTCTLITDLEGIGDPNWDTGPITVESKCPLKIEGLGVFNMTYEFKSKVSETVDWYRGNIKQDPWWSVETTIVP